MPREVKNVFVWGVFDILHDGHLKLLEVASGFGNIFVITPPDKKLITWKKFVFDEETRRKNLLKTGYVKEVYVDSLPEMKCFEITRPDIFCFGYDQSPEWKERLIERINNDFPSCRFMTMEEYGSTHSSHLRGAINCPCGSGKMWKDCHGK